MTRQMTSGTMSCKGAMMICGLVSASRRNLAFLILLVLFAPGLQAQDPWIRLAQSADGELRIFVDPARVTQNGTVVETWLKFDFPNGNTAANGRRFQHYLTLMEIDCGRSRFRPTASIYYDRNGRVVTSWEDEYSSWERAVPDTVMEKVVNELCAFDWSSG